MLAVAQCLFLKSCYFKNLMRAFSLKFHILEKRMRAMDQKHNYQLEWPNVLAAVSAAVFYAKCSTCRGVARIL